MSMKYGIIGACAGFAFAVLIVFFAARGNATHIDRTAVSDVRVRD